MCAGAWVMSLRHLRAVVPDAWDRRNLLDYCLSDHAIHLVRDEGQVCSGEEDQGCTSAAVPLAVTPPSPLGNEATHAHGLNGRRTVRSIVDAVELRRELHLDVLKLEVR